MTDFRQRLICGFPCCSYLQAGPHPPPRRDAAMARARRRSRAPEGRTERQSRRGHRPGHRPGKVRADAPRDTRRARYSPIKETIFALPPSGEYGGAGGVEGQPPLSPHAPRRAGDPPPRPGSSRRPRMKEKRQSKKVSFPLTTCPTPGNSRNSGKKKSTKNGRPAEA